MAWENLGGIFSPYDRVAVVSWGPERLDIFARASGTPGTSSAAIIDHVMWKVWDNGGWWPSQHDWLDLAGLSVSAPAAVSWGRDHIEIFIHGYDDGLYFKKFSGGGWNPPLGGWDLLDGPPAGRIKRRPTVVSWGRNRLDLFVRGSEDNVWHRARLESNWDPWEDLGRPGGVGIFGVPAAVAPVPGRLDIVVHGQDNKAYYQSWNGAWKPSWDRLGGEIYDTPTIVSESGMLHIVSRGTDSSVPMFSPTGQRNLRSGDFLHKSGDGMNWRPGVTKWEDIDGLGFDEPAAASWGPKRIDVVVKWLNRGIFQKGWDGQEWDAHWQDLGGRFFGEAPSVVAWGKNRLDILVVGDNSSIWHRAWNGSEWIPTGD